MLAKKCRVDEELEIEVEIQQICGEARAHLSPLLSLWFIVITFGYEIIVDVLTVIIQRPNRGC